MIHGVFFDLDGTLYDRDEHLLRITRQQFAAFATDLKGIEIERFVDRVLELDAHGHGRTPDLYHVLVGELGCRAELGLRLDAHFRATFHRSLSLSADTLSTLTVLRARGKKLGIITNGPVYWQSNKVDALRIREFFDTVVISAEEGIEKPHPEIFRRALARCGIDAADALFVGDHPVADIEGAQGAGLRAVWKRMPYWKVPSSVPCIDSLSEILPLCNES